MSNTANAKEKENGVILSRAVYFLESFELPEEWIKKIIILNDDGVIYITHKLIKEDIEKIILFHKRLVKEAGRKLRFEPENYMDGLEIDPLSNEKEMAEARKKRYLAICNRPKI